MMEFYRRRLTSKKHFNIYFLICNFFFRLLKIEVQQICSQLESSIKGTQELQCCADLSLRAAHA